MGNFGGPFTINLLGEILLISGSIGVRLLTGAAVAGLSFFSAAYRLVLYASTLQGPNLIASRPLAPMETRESVILFSHVWPIVLLILVPALL